MPELNKLSVTVAFVIPIRANSLDLTDLERNSKALGCAASRFANWLLTGMNAGNKNMNEVPLSCFR